jgi:multidrug resistance efflux pump
MENPQKSSPEIEKLQQQIDQKKALLAKKKSQLAEKQKKEARANETRRKILAGAVVLQRAQTDPEFAALLFRLIGGSVTEKRNRDLFPEIGQE